MTASAWLVDMAYVVKAARGIFQLDYARTHAFLEMRMGPTRVFLFNGFDAAYGIPEGLEQFYDSMRRRGMEVRLQPMESGPPGTNRQRRVDVDFTAHLVWQASIDAVETLCVTTGDQDFVPAIELVRRRFATNVILFAYSAGVHKDLAASVDARWLFEEHEQDLARVGSRSRR